MFPVKKCFPAHKTQLCCFYVNLCFKLFLCEHKSSPSVPELSRVVIHSEVTNSSAGNSGFLTCVQLTMTEQAAVTKSSLTVLRGASSCGAAR